MNAALKDEPRAEAPPPSAPAQAPQWYHLGEKGSRWGITFMLWVYRLFGRPVAEVFLYPIVAYFFLRHGRERRASLDYLRRLRAAYPEALPGAPGWGGVYRHFLEFAQMILDRPAIITGETRGYRFTRHGQELLERLARDKRGAVLLSSHVGSLDIMRLLAEDCGIVINALMFRGNSQKVSSGFQPLYGQRNIRILEHDPSSVDTVFELRKCIERGELIALNIDRVAPSYGQKRERVSWIPFLGKQAAFPQSPLLLASLLECPVLLTFGLRTGDRSYEFYAEEFAERIVLPRGSRQAQLDAALRKYAGRLEFYCRKAPYQWFNFFDFWGGKS